MNAEIELETEKPETFKKILQPSLKTDKRVKYDLETTQNTLQVQIQTDKLGVLRGCTDNLFRLSTIIKKNINQ